MAADTIPCTSRPGDTAATEVRPSTASQKNSDGPNRSDNRARGTKASIRTSVPKSPPKTEANSAR